MEMTKMCRDKFVESLAAKSLRCLEEFNALKGGDEKVLELVDSDK